ncbi:glycerophosphodiester phosphodiesterase [Paeniglutamicibacter cryotolerans]|uniref:Glycerophosphoryl diester phosphodiesterase n=1 Tax=Paeniglutamicibacter cryotolerans TaxID=670079 RepID=A0A839QPA8_9MICC|nr:glycerophosphodiester phosphodiesterase family protein [Paeniglutamicibacter cryotolerans]MBB2995062.1 glycerophosphoryl diester phosphodiesterase [Paeniglutamicibacter cryotolerans]
MSIFVFAHRGSSERFAENTRAAYLQALVEGADGIECDVHLSADGQVVCHHDPTVNRTSNATGRVAELTLAQLRALDFCSWKGAELPSGYGGPHEQLLTLGELVGLMLADGSEVGLAVEIKHPSPFGRKLEERVLEELRALGWGARDSQIGNITVSFMSFDPGSVDWLLGHVPAEYVCQLVTSVDAEWIDELARDGMVDKAAVAGVLAESMEAGVQLLDRGLPGIAGPGVSYLRAHPDALKRWLDNGRTFRVWTVDREKDADYLVAAGVTQLTSNRPALLKEYLGLAAGRG